MDLSITEPHLVFSTSLEIKGRLSDLPRDRQKVCGRAGN